MFYGGTSGLVLPVANKTLYPTEFKDKSRLNYYSSLFNSIEVNSSFYKIPQPSTVKKWLADVPEGFRFTFKLWRGITHNKHLVFDDNDIGRFMDAINNASDKKGCILIQFPKSLDVNSYSRLVKLLEIINAANTYNWNLALEFRNPAWYIEEIYELMEEYKAAVVLHDMPGSATPMTSPKPSFVYLRFHGPEGKYRGSYTDDLLTEYASYINEWQEEGKTVYCYFNNTMGNALQNLVTLNNLVSPQA